MRIAIGSDHAGFDHKEAIKQYLDDKGIEFHDFGTFSKDPADYSDFGRIVAEAVAAGDYDRGILICGTGLGMSIVANRVPGIRGTLCHDTMTARLAREHNDSNVLIMGARIIPIELAIEITETWLVTKFEGGRHIERLRKIDADRLRS